MTTTPTTPKGAIINNGDAPVYINGGQRIDPTPTAPVDEDAFKIMLYAWKCA